MENPAPNGPVEEAPKDADPADTAPKPTPKPAPKPAETPSGGLTNDERAELERLRGIHADEQKWQARSRANAAKLRELAETMGIPREEFNPGQFDPKSEFDKLRAEVEAERIERARVEIAAAAGVPTELVQGTDRESMQAFVAKLSDWAKAAAPKPPAEPKQTAPNAADFKGGEEIKPPKTVTAAEYAAIKDPEKRRELRQKGLVEGFGAAGSR